MAMQAMNTISTSLPMSLVHDAPADDEACVAQKGRTKSVEALGSRPSSTF